MWGRVGQAGALALTLVWAATSGVGAQVQIPQSPANLSVPVQHTLAFQTSATGVQTYVCKTRPDNAAAFEWTFVAPTAELWDAAGQKVGLHYAGPTWEGADGSKVVGKVLERADAVAPGAIPWLLLEATTHDGTGVFGDVSYIQRLETVGGVAPTDGCDQSAAGAERAVEYTALYAFYRPG